MLTRERVFCSSYKGMRLRKAFKAEIRLFSCLLWVSLCPFRLLGFAFCRWGNGFFVLPIRGWGCERLLRLKLGFLVAWCGCLYVLQGFWVSLCADEGTGFCSSYKGMRLRKAFKAEFRLLGCLMWASRKAERMVMRHAWNGKRYVSYSQNVAPGFFHSVAHQSIIMYIHIL